MTSRQKPSWRWKKPVGTAQNLGFDFRKRRVSRRDHQQHATGWSAHVASTIGGFGSGPGMRRTLVVVLVPVLVPAGSGCSLEVAVPLALEVLSSFCWWPWPATLAGWCEMVLVRNRLE